MENSVAPINEIEANQPANPESGEGHNQPEETGTEHVISIRDRWEERCRALMDAPVKEEDKGHTPFIGQVPMFLRKKTELEEYFQPCIMSIGPVHHYENELEQGQQYKLQLTKDFIMGNRLNHGTICDDILKEIESFKECYDHQELPKKFHGNDEGLAWMFFVDGCALIQLVRGWLGNNFFDYQMDLLTTDLLLLDNQLPLGVLNLIMRFDKEGEELYQNDHPVGEQSKQFRDSICEFIILMAELNFNTGKMHRQAAIASFNGANHLLELIWKILAEKPYDYCSDDTWATPGQFRSVKDLQAAGIILEPNKCSWFLRDISFTGVKLKIPSFCVSEQGKLLVFNLIAFEMHPNFDKDRVVTSYISFLNSLMETKEDVAELLKAKILLNYLRNDEEVLKTFRELTSSLKPYPDFFYEIKVKLIRYCNDKKNITRITKWLNEAKHIYFRSPWTIIGVVSASFLLILTIIQTIFSILAYSA